MGGGLHAGTAAAWLQDRSHALRVATLMRFHVPKQGLIIQATELGLQEAAKLNETGST